MLILDDLAEELNDYETVFAEDDDIGRFNYESIKKFLDYGKMSSPKGKITHLTSLWNINDDGSVSCKEFREVE